MRTTDELIAGLNELGACVKQGTVWSWSSKGIIGPPTRSGQKGRRGRFTEWPSSTLETAAAYWSFVHATKKHDAFGTHFAATKYVPAIKDTVAQIYASNLWCTSQIVWGLLEPYEEIRSACVYPGRLFGPSAARSVVVLLIPSWILGLEKARHGWNLDSPAEVHFTWPVTFQIRDIDESRLTGEWEWNPQFRPRYSQPTVTLHKSSEDRLLFWGIFNICLNSQTAAYDRPFIDLLSFTQWLKDDEARAFLNTHKGICDDPRGDGQ